MSGTCTFPTIFAIIVTYQPENARLAMVLDAIFTQCRLVVVDNGDVEEFCKVTRKLCEEKQIPLLSMGGNMGIAKAQNVGIQWALEQGASHVLLLDDDSLAPPCMVENLHNMIKIICGENQKVVCVGARALDSFGRNLSSVNMSKRLLSECWNFTSSGSLIPVEAFRIVGRMDEALFIDCVDYDWGWRARSKGIEIYLSNEVVMEHRLGMGRVDIFGLRVGIPSPIRHYYQYRNIPRMLLRPYVPLRWKIKQAISLLLKPFFTIVFLDQKGLRLGYMFKGLVDFVGRRQGSYAE